MLLTSMGSTLRASLNTYIPALFILVISKRKTTFLEIDCKKNQNSRYDFMLRDVRSFATSAASMQIGKILARNPS